jgi:hypothetical protein
MQHVIEWKSIPEFPDYEISEHGDVRRGGHIKTQMQDRNGYRWVGLWQGGKSHTRHIAKIVAQVFIGPMPGGQQVRHMDGKKTHNHFTNLEYGTRVENEHDKRRHGTAPIGENHPAAKLTPQQVAEIRARYVKSSRTSGLASLASEFGISLSMVCRIAKKNSWKHIP